MTDELSIQRRGSAAWFTLNRARELNSLSLNLLKALDLGLAEMLGDRSVRTIVFTGAGRAFCAGADLKFLETLPDHEREEVTAAFLLTATTLMSRIAASPKPTIAAVNGTAVGGGLELLLACDIIVAVRGAPIGDGHANYGLLPGAGSSIRLPRRIGIGRAKQLLFTGELLPAERLAEFGLVNEVVEPAELHARVDAIATALATKSPIGLARMKQIVEHAFDMSESAGLALEQALSNLHTTSFDRSEGLAAFRERRKPNFLGR
jgi:enoyl-CoA hydratase/carnithine racemase